MEGKEAMTTISDPLLADLFLLAESYIDTTTASGEPICGREAFILALNERLQAADTLARVIARDDIDLHTAQALAAYRRCQPTHHMACLTVVTGGLEGPCDCGVSQ